jgi:hypothetical protein
MQLLHSVFVSQIAGVELFCVGGVVVGGLQPSASGEWLCMGARLHCLEFEGPGEQVGSEGGTAGIPGRSPPS